MSIQGCLVQPSLNWLDKGYISFPGTFATLLEQASLQQTNSTYDSQSLVFTTCSYYSYHTLQNRKKNKFKMLTRVKRYSGFLKDYGALDFKRLFDLAGYEVIKLILDDTLSI